MTTNEPPPYPGDSAPGETPAPAAPGGSGTSDLPSYGSVQPPEGGTPPPPPPPPDAPSGSLEEFSAPAAIGWGWERFKENVGQSLLAMLIFVVVSAVLSGIASLITPGGGVMYPGTSLDFNGGDIVLTFIVSVIVSALSYVVTVAIARATIDVTNGESLDVTGAFGKINMTNAIVAGLIVGVLTQVGFALLVVPGIIVTFFAYFTAYFVADGASPVDGLQKSFSLVAANLGSSLVLAILSILVVIVGVIALCVGVFVAAPVTFFASAYAYRRFQGQPVTG